MQFHQGEEEVARLPLVEQTKAAKDHAANAVKM